jgi:hypothetical protein
MSEYPNSGALFKNHEKRSDKSPDYSGKVEVDGKEYRIAAWVKEGKKGKFFSLKFTPADEKPEARSEPPPPSQGELDDEIPF